VACGLPEGVSPDRHDDGFGQMRDKVFEQQLAQRDTHGLTSDAVIVIAISPRSQHNKPTPSAD